jgi:uncharacterized membrane protein HdeD (DUF308 family)
MATLYDRLVDPGSENARISDLWWVVALKGVSAFVLGTLAVLWPAITLITLALIFAAYCVVDAVFSIILAVRGARRHQRWWWPALNAVVALAAAAVAVLYPGLTVLVFVIMLAAWALINGVISIIAAFRLKADHGRWWLVITGVVSVLLGVLLIALPGIGLFTLTWLIAFQGWLAAGALLGLAYRLRVRRSERIARNETANSPRRDSSATTA